MPCRSSNKCPVSVAFAFSYKVWIASLSLLQNLSIVTTPFSYLLHEIH